MPPFPAATPPRSRARKRVARVGAGVSAVVGLALAFSTNVASLAGAGGLAGRHAGWVWVPLVSFWCWRCFWQ